MTDFVDLFTKRNMGKLGGSYLLFFLVEMRTIASRRLPKLPKSTT